VGVLATNTISEGDTREVGLDQILLRSVDGRVDNALYRAVKSIKWPSKSATLEIAKLWLRKGPWSGALVLDGSIVPVITAYLSSETASVKPYPLQANKGLSYIGSYVLGMGFVLEPEVARNLMELDGNHSEVLFPYLTGEDLNSRVDQSPSRWVINFHNWPLGRVGQMLPISGEPVLDVIRAANPHRSADWFPGPRSSWIAADDKRRGRWLQLGIVPADYPGPVAADYPRVLELVERDVREERQRPAERGPDKKGRNFQLRYPLAERFWQHADKRPELYEAVRRLHRCLALTIVTQYPSFCWQPTDIVFAHRVAVFPREDDGFFSVLQSSFHGVWARLHSSTLRVDPNYSPSDAFETFPLPPQIESLDKVGQQLDKARRVAMFRHGIGLKELTKAIHDPDNTDDHIGVVRQAIIANDEAVAAAYGWSEIVMGHGFYGDPVRYGVPPCTRSEMLSRLLQLNRERYEEETTPSLDGAMKVAEKRAVYDAPITGGLFGSGDWEEVEA
jgi:hypothetical protein